MKQHTKEEINDMREQLADSEWEGLKDRDLREVLWDGCVGWKNMPDEDIVKQFTELYEFEIVKSEDEIITQGDKKLKEYLEGKE